MKHPGFDWVVSPTSDWHVRAPDAFAWAAYSAAGERVAGFAATAEEAERDAREASRKLKDCDV